MKRIIAILLLFISAKCFSQTDNNFMQKNTFNDTVYFKVVPYNSGAGIVALGLDTVVGSPTFGKLVRKTAGGGTPTLQQVLLSGNTVTSVTTDTIFSISNSVASGQVEITMADQFQQSQISMRPEILQFNGATIVLNTDNVLLNGSLPSGAVTDSVLVWDAVNKTIRVRSSGNAISHARATAQTSANTNILTYATGASDGTFQISANVLVTASATHSFTVTVDYTDEGNTARTVTLTFSQLAGTFITAITNVTGAAPYEGVPLTIRAKASTNIVFKTAGTFTSVTYNVDANITKLN